MRYIYCVIVTRDIARHVTKNNKNPDRDAALVAILLSHFTSGTEFYRL